MLKKLVLPQQQHQWLMTTMNQPQRIVLHMVKWLTISFSGWTHSGICERRALISRNTKPELTFWMNKSVKPTNLQMIEGLFFMSFIKSVILPQTNNNLPAGEKHVQYGEFLCWLGLWMLMGTLIGPQRHKFWSTHTINAFHGGPLHLGVWMSRKHFDAFLSALSFTDAIPPTFLNRFWEI